MQFAVDENRSLYTGWASCFNQGFTLTTKLLVESRTTPLGRRLGHGSQVRLQTKCWVGDLAVVAIVIALMLVIAPVATLADFFELAAALLGLVAALAVFADGLLQIFFRLSDIMAAPVITVGAGGRRHSAQ